MRNLFRIAALIIASTVMPHCLHAQAGNDTVVSIVNFYPGAEIFELEGHTALRIQFPDGRDLAVSYGMFSFNEPNFVYRFVKGETDYWVATIPWSYFSDGYIAQGRRIAEHRLNMNSSQKARLISLLTDNLQPENATYRYNYVRDNCATRPLGIIEKALGDSIILGNPRTRIDREVSFRDIMRHYHRNYPWYQFGIDLALGSGIDLPLTNREKAFAPIVLDRQLTDATAGGKRLVGNTIILNDVAEDNATAPPTPWYMTPFFVFTLWMLLVLMVTIRDIRRLRSSRWLDTILFSVYGMAGCVVFYLVTVSSHEATSPNWLVAWLNPLCFIAAIGIWIKRARKLVMWYQIANFAVILLLSAAWPFMRQSGNPAFIPLVIAELLRSGCYIYLTFHKKVHAEIAHR